MSSLMTRRRHDPDTADQLVAIQDGRAMEKDQNGLGVSEEGVSYTLDGTGAQAVSVAQNQRGELRERLISPQLTAGGSKPGEGYPAIRSGQMVRRLTPTECERLQSLPDQWTLTEEQTRFSDCAECDCNEYAGPRTCPEHPDGPTFTTDPNPQPDGRRYAACGDAVTANVSEWIGKRILAHDPKED